MAKNVKPNPAKPASIPQKKVDLTPWYLIIIIATVFVLYGRAIYYQYVKMDDTDLIVENEVFIKHLKNIPQAFRQSCFEIPGHLTENKSYYRPMLIVSFMLDAQMGGARSSRTFHFMNILYHILCCVLLFSLIKKLSNANVAFVLTFLFAVHPVNVHAIAWVPGRNDILLAIFGLISLHGLIDYYKKNKTGYLVLHLAGYAAALFTKESGVILLAIYGGFMWLWMKDLDFYRRKIFIPVLYTLITLIWYLAMTTALKGHEKIGGGESIVKLLMHNAPYLFLYIGKILLPFNLSVMPGVDVTNFMSGDNLPALIFGCISLIALAVLLLRIKDRSIALSTVFWYFIFIAPTLLVPDLPAYEHRDYFPLIGLLIGLSQADFFKGFVIKAGNLAYALGALAVTFIIVSFMRIPVFADRFVFWNDATEGTPFAPSACVNVGQLYQDMFDNDPELNPSAKKTVLAKAGEWNHKALLIDSTTLRGNNNYGAFLYLKGDTDKALPYFLREIRHNPTNSDPYKNVAIYYRNKGMANQSVPYWEKLIQLNKYNLQAYEDLSRYYRSIGDMNKAMIYTAKEKELSDQAEQDYNKIK